MPLIDYLKRLFSRRQHAGDNTATALAARPEVVRDLLHAVEHTLERELACDEVFAVLDQYAEAVQRGEDVAQLMPLVKHHLEMCRDCREEFEALLAVLRGAGA